MSEKRRLQRERKTVRLMVEVYCAHHHRGDGLYSACAELADYADRKLELCPYGPEKPTCNNCPIHCYRPEPRERMRVVMRHSGPRMLKTHPILAVMHIFDGRRGAPPLPNKDRPG